MTYAELTDPQKARIAAWADPVYRPLLREVARLRGPLGQALDGYLASPSGLPSTVQAPAADSIAALLAGLDAGEAVPNTSSGYPGVGAIPAAAVGPDLAAVAGILATYYTDALRQYRASVVGAANAGV